MLICSCCYNQKADAFFSNTIAVDRNRARGGGAAGGGGGGGGGGERWDEGRGEGATHDRREGVKCAIVNRMSVLIEA